MFHTILIFGTKQYKIKWVIEIVLDNLLCKVR